MPSYVRSNTSLNNLMAWVKQGAVGETYKELEQFQHIDTGLDEHFATALRDISVVDFDTKNSITFTDSPDPINKWVSDKTEGRIKQAVESVSDPNLKMILLNILNFKQMFKEPFNKDKSTVMDFNGRDHTYMVDKREIKSNVFSGASAAVIPFKDDSELVLIMTDQKMDTELFMQCYALCHMQETHISIPIFTLEHETNCIPLLREKGVNKIFNTDAQLDKISPDVFCSNITQKCFFMLDETGVEASAVTSMYLSLRCASTPLKIVFNKPFYFFVRKNNVDVFEGYYC